MRTRRLRTRADRVTEERWSTTFRPRLLRRAYPVRRNRFRAESSRDYQSRIEPSALVLALHRPDLFAWTDAGNQRYRDFILSADLRFESGDSLAGGFLFRKLYDHTFYYLLVTNDGRYRFDSVVNGNPTPLIPWTACNKVSVGQTFTLRVLGRGNAFSFYLDEEWIGEAVDDSIDEGAIAFAGQNYENRCELTLRSLLIESRPVRVEAAFYRDGLYLTADPERRVALARTFSRMGRFGAAGAQLDRVKKSRPLTADEEFLLAETHMNMNEYGDALVSIDRVLGLQPSNEAAIAEKANLLYLNDRQAELMSHFKANEMLLSKSAGMLNLVGNCCYALSQWNDAVALYTKAIELQDDVALFHLNLARTLERTGQVDAAAKTYQQAARLFLQDDAFDEIDRIVARLEVIAASSLSTIEIGARLAFAEERLEDAKRMLEEAISSGSVDSSVFFLHGVVTARGGDRLSADESFARAIELEPEVPVYHLRYAENRVLADMDAESAIERALELSPEDGWILNLCGLFLLERGRNAEAAERFSAARAALPHETEIVANLAVAQSRTGEVEAALELLESLEALPVAIYQRGVILAESGNLPEAIDSAREACRAEPANETYRETLASLLLKEDRVHEAESILRELLESMQTPRRLNLIAQVARSKGEISRSESALVEALRLDPGKDDLKYNLASHYAFTGTWDSAIAAIDGCDDERSSALRERVYRASRRRIECVGCGREWWAPKDLEKQPTLKLRGEPPTDSPAGQCGACGAIFCVECAELSSESSRFHCTKCGERLNLNDDHLKYVVKQHVR